MKLVTRDSLAYFWQKLSETLVGWKTTGKVFTVNDTEVTAKEGAEIFNDPNNIATGLYSIAEGNETMAIGDYSHAEGVGTTASGLVSRASGYLTVASGNFSVAEGTRTLASMNNAHAEGDTCQATANNTHAEGYNTKATLNQAHAEGASTEANGLCSHSEGWYTVANGRYQHVQGVFNIADTTSLHIVGNGSSSTARANAHTLDWNGVGWYASDIRYGGTNQDDAVSLKSKIEELENLIKAVLPEPTADTEGAFLRIVDGKWTSVVLQNAEDVAF